MIWTHSIPHSPVPQFLRETLKDHPELIQEIQDVPRSLLELRNYFEIYKGAFE